MFFTAAGLAIKHAARQGRAAYLSAKPTVRRKNIFLEDMQMFENYKVFKYTLAGRPLVIVTGKLAGLANGS